MAKQRLDLVIIQQRPDLSRAFIQSIIMQGKVKVDGQITTKAGTLIALDAQIDMDVTQPKYVSRAGFKLEAALDAFNLDVSDLVALDAGISTGGFSDCMLQRGIAKIYGIDVGYGQVHEKVRNDERVIVMERTNLRHLASLPELVDLVTLDLSFISVLKVIEAVKNVIKPDGRLIVLIKPQFEAERFQIGKGGIVTDPSVHETVIKKVTSGIADQGFEYKGIIESPILGGDGNKEFLALFVKK
ncbi:TlyA family RNA methyltransferase [Candidatus Dependentiae bacterium]|nr:TlyA family RNA methyltransferase [Candidatus Dependentiae bacterium]